MPTATATTPAERYQALQQLEAAYSQPDGNMFFTYNGASYRSIGVNGDGTLRVIDQTTGQIMNLDPVDIYAAARAAAGDPLPPPPTPDSLLSTVYGPSKLSNVMGQIGTYSSLVNMASQI